MGWQKNGLANSDLPKRSETFERSMPDGICRIGIRQPRHFRYRFFFSVKKKA
ncbi:MAG TPA: hypothetical protein PLI24_07410 [Candidatus Cloacimonas sp.]|nr:hypothetical protein [Candidatus Cloacimonas sp.]